MREKRHIKAKPILFVAIASFIIAPSILCYIVFGTFNCPKVAIALSSINAGRAKYVEVSSRPTKVVLATPDDPMKAFTEYMEENGYTIVEDKQLGGCYCVSKNDIEEKIFFSVNGYYSLWRWAGNSD
ncbi:MAG: hypothetical protein K6A29_01955 [Lachnospiraceae bacterium]|nr:hypothetical protein [Lachnospiraceae bacterium]